MRRVAVQDVFDASPNPYMVLDRELRYVTANRAYLAITGSKLSDLIGKCIFDAFPNDAGDAGSEPRRLLEASLRKVLATRQRDVISHIPYRVQRTPGGEPELRIWAATHTPLLDEHGEVELILQHTEDVTALYESENECVAELRVHAEQLRRVVLERDEQLRKLLAMLDLAPGFFAFMRGPEQVFELVNRAYERLVGTRELIGLPARDALPDLAPEYHDVLARAFATGKPVVGRGVRLELARQPGGELEEVYVDFVAQPLLDDDGASLGVLVQGQDVSEQKRGELRQGFLARASEKIATGVDNIESALVQVAWAAVATISDWAFVDVFEDGASRRLVAAHADEAHAADARELEHYPVPVEVPPAHPLHSLRDTPVVLTRLPGGNAPTLVRTPEYLALVRRIGFHSALALPLWHRARLYGVLTLATARTHRRFDEADVPAMIELSRVIAGAMDNARLAREREEALARELEARQRAEAANQAKDDFLAILGHELRNPLAPILTAVQLMRLRGDTATLREQSIIERQTQHMVRLVDDLLDVSRIAHGKIELRRATVEISTVAAKALEIASPLIDERGHQLQVSVPHRGLRVDGDEARLAQVIANLLTNAARYTPPGGRIWLDAAREEDEVVIKVRDNGVGMEPDALGRVFDMFLQAPRRSPQVSSGGLGLGLTLVQRLTELHGGRVTASSEGPGQGCEFVVRLPALATRGSAADTGAAEPGRALTLCRRVVLVDDNEDAAELLGELVRRRGHEVMLAHDGEQGLAMILEHRPDVAVVDIGLPGIDGYQVALRVREALGDRAPILIALTGYGAENDRARSRSAGFAAHLTKPVDSASLLELVSATRIAS